MASGSGQGFHHVAARLVELLDQGLAREDAVRAVPGLAAEEDHHPGGGDHHVGEADGRGEPGGVQDEVGGRRGLRLGGRHHPRRALVAGLLAGRFVLAHRPLHLGSRLVWNAS